MHTILALTSFEKGQPFLEECKARGARIILLTVESLRDADWPRHALDELFVMPTLYDRNAVLNAVSYLARSHRLDRIVGLDELNVEMAATLREHLALPGMDESTTRHFRDKLAMRTLAREASIPVPAFTRLHPYDDIRAYIESVPAPWVLKPRTEASAVGIRKLHEAERLWRTLDELGDEQSHFLLEQFLPGDVYHADAIVVAGNVVFCEVHRYHRPPFDVYHGGGLFLSSTVARGSVDEGVPQALTQRVATALDMDDGILHTEFIRDAEGHFYFLEVACRVGGANIADLVEASTGVNLWREWARLEVARAAGQEYKVQPERADYGGVIISLAKQQWPDLSGYTDAEIALRIRKEYHAGFVLRSHEEARVNQLLDEYAERFMHDFHASLPPQTSIR